jgi:predicted alpha/beta hydrolase family esterase
MSAAAASRRFLILHGVENWRPREHWQWWLADELRARGEQVLYPQLPSPSSPAFDVWLAVLRGELAQLGQGERIVVAHSCGAVLWLLAAPELAEDLVVDRVALVAPPGPSAFIAPYRAFLPVGIDWAAVARASRQLPVVIGSDNDPYVREGIETTRSTYVEPLQLEHVLIKGSGHLTIEDGYGRWPAMLEWCLSGRFPSDRTPNARRWAP